MSLCRVGNADLPARAEHVEVRLIDQEGENTNLDFVLLDTVRAVEQLRREGRTVLIHSVQAQRRTPTVAALYGARLRGDGIVDALAEVYGRLIQRLSDTRVRRSIGTNFIQPPEKEDD